MIKTQTKTCTKCGKEFPATVEFFYRSKKGKYGVQSECKQCVAKYNSTPKQKVSRKRRGKLYRQSEKGKATKARMNKKRNQWRKVFWLKYRASRWNYTYGSNLTETQLQDLLDLQNNQCVLCGSILDRHCHLDHIVPYVLGGNSNIDNLQFLCESCNRGKWKWSVEEYLSHCEKVVKFNNL